MISQKTKKTAYSFLFIFSLFFLSAGDWSRGVSLESEEDKSAALVFYKEWLDDNQDSEDYFQVYKRFLSIQPNLSSFIQEAGKERPLEPQQEAEILYWSAEILSLSGEIEKAYNYYISAYEKYPVIENAGILLKSAELQVRMGRYQEAEKILLFLNKLDLTGELNEKILILISRLKLQQGQGEAAVSVIKDLIEQTGNKSLSLLNWSRELFKKSGDLQSAEDVESQLEGLFPNRWTSVEIPETIFGFFKERENTIPVLNSAPLPDNSIPLTFTSERLIRIQIGSYKDRDNALEQIKVLKSAGFTAEINSVIINGTQYHRVLVSGITEEDLAETTLQLKEAGFEGFPVY